MLIAAVIDENEIILPIVEGVTLRLYNTDSKIIKDFPNPAMGLTEGRRGAVLRFAEQNGAEAFVAPPNTFCELSYKVAQKDEVRFFNIATSTSFKSFEQNLLKGQISTQTFLPDIEIVPSGKQKKREEKIVEFITMAPTSGDGEYVGAMGEGGAEQFDGWTGANGSSSRPATPEYIKAVATAAEKGGFSTLLLPVGSNCLDSLVVAANLISHTEKLNILFAVRPGFTSPAHFAKQFATLDQWSKGRVFFNIVTGGSPKELASDGDFLDHDARYRRSREFIQVLNLFFSGEPFDFNGEFYKLENAKLHIKPFQQPKVFFGGSSPIAKQIASELADVYMVWGETLENTKKEIEEVKKLVSEKDRDVSYSISFQIVLGETEEQAWENADRIISRAESVALENKNELNEKGEAVGVKRLHQLMVNSKYKNFKIGTNLWAGLTQVLSGNSIALVGTADQVAARIVEYIDLGFDKILLRGFPHLETAEKVGELVIPRVLEQLNV